MKEYWNNLSTAKKIRLIVTALLVICALTFALQNWTETEVRLVFFRISMPLTLVILFSGIIGFAFASIFDYRKFKKRDAEIKKLNDEKMSLLAKVHPDELR